MEGWRDGSLEKQLPSKPRDLISNPQDPYTPGLAACINNSSIPMGKEETEMEDSLEAQKPNCLVHRDAINKDILSNTR